MAVERNVIPVSVEDRFVNVGDHTKVMAGNVGVDWVAIALDSEWSGLDVEVSFTGCLPEPTTADYAAEVEVPWEQIAEPCDLYIAIQGFDPSAAPTVDAEGGTVEEAPMPVLNAATMTVPITVYESGESGGMEPQQPTNSVLQRVQQDILALERGIGSVEGSASKAEQAVEDAKKAVADANSAIKAATDSYAEAEAERGKRYEAAEDARDTSYAAAESVRDESFGKALEGWEERYDASAIVSSIAAADFYVDDGGNLACAANCEFRLTDTGDLEVVA